MAYNTKNLKTDAGTKQIPQFYDSAADDYYALLGTDGAGPHYVNFDTSGDELFVAANPGIVAGTAAHGAAASGNPVQAAGVYRSADPALDDGDVGSLRVNAAGELITETQLTGSNAGAHESVTVDSTAGGKALTAGTYGTYIYAFITAETAQMRYTVDGTAPTTANGHLLNPGDILKLDSNADIVAFRAIRTGSVSGVIKVTYSGVA